MPSRPPVVPYTTLFRSRSAARAGRRRAPCARDLRRDAAPVRGQRGGRLRAGTPRRTRAPRAGAPCAAHGLEHARADPTFGAARSEEHTSELQSPCNLVCRRVHQSFPTRRSSDLEALRERAAAARPVLGICVGMQLLFEDSEEGGCGLGLLEGHVRRVRARRVPHMGWNTLALTRPSELLDRKSTRLNSSHLVISYAVASTSRSLHDALPISKRCASGPPPRALCSGSASGCSSCSRTARRAVAGWDSSKDTCAACGRAVCRTWAGTRSR